MNESMPIRVLAATVGTLFAPGGMRGCLSTLIYHRVLTKPDELNPNEVDADTFEQQMRLLAEHCHVLPLDEAIERLYTRSLPARAVCVTFDDGYADNATIALPILRRYGLSATFFVSTGYLDGGRMWNDTVIEAIRRAPDDVLDLTAEGFGVLPVGSINQRIHAFQCLIDNIKYRSAEERIEITEAIVARVGAVLPDDLMMSSDQVRDLHAAGMAIGAHTVNHPILARSSNHVAREEVANSRSRLQEIIGKSVELFAYPNGKPGCDYLSEHVDIVRELGFKAAVSTAWGVATATTDRWQLPRFTPWDRHPLKFLARLYWNCYRHV